MPTYLGIEGGGTTWKVAIAKDRVDNIVAYERFGTTSDPMDTLVKVKEWAKKYKYDAVGVATFGPVDPKVGSPTWGYITTTPKKGWANTDVMGVVTDGSVPRAFDTDVNAPALAEFIYNAKPNESSVVYITVGTGVGVGLVVNGKPIHGLLHPEGGHVPLKRIPGDTFEGTELYHGDCVEGLCNTAAIAKRKSMNPHDLAKLPDDDPVWDSVAHALASLCVTLVLLVSPERIVLSGGVMQRQILFPKIRAKTLEILNNYINHPLLTPEGIDKYITPSTWGDNAGIIGALTLAKVALDEKQAENKVVLRRVLQGLGTVAVGMLAYLLASKKRRS